MEENSSPRPGTVAFTLTTVARQCGVPVTAHDEGCGWTVGEGPDAIYVYWRPGKRIQGTTNVYRPGARKALVRVNHGEALAFVRSHRTRETF